MAHPGGDGYHSDEARRNRRLAEVRQTPCHDPAVCRQGQAVLGARSDRDHLGQARGHVGLAAAVASPRDDPAVRHRKAVLGACRDRGHLGQPGRHSGLAESVAAPGHYRAGHSQREAVVAAGSHLRHAAQAAGHFRHGMGRAAPGDDPTVGRHGQAVIPARRNSDHPVQVRGDLDLALVVVAPGDDHGLASYFRVLRGERGRVWNGDLSSLRRVYPKRHGQLGDHPVARLRRERHPVGEPAGREPGRGAQVEALRQALEQHGGQVALHRGDEQR